MHVPQGRDLAGSLGASLSQGTSAALLTHGSSWLDAQKGGLMPMSEMSEMSEMRRLSRVDVLMRDQHCLPLSG